MADQGRGPIVIIDDDQDEHYFIKLAFSKFNLPNEIHFFFNGKEFLMATEEGRIQRPAFVLLDLNMPVMDGIQTLKALREKKDFTELPVIILSTSTHERDIERSMANGATAYISKPSLMSEYEQIIKRLIAERL